MPQYIGIGHVSRTGKDTFAYQLWLGLRRRRINAHKRSFAAKLKEVAYDLYNWAGLQGEDYYNMAPHEHERTVKLPALGMTPVEIWCKLGTDAIRNQVYERTWLEYMLHNDYGAQLLIIPDVRFRNEAEAVLENGGMLIRVDRPGFKPLTEIDKQLSDFDGWTRIVTAKTPDELHAQARDLAIEIKAEWDAKEKEV